MELLPTFCVLMFFIFVALLARSSIRMNKLMTRILLVFFYISAFVAVISLYLFSQKIYFLNDFLNKTVIWYPMFFAGILLGVGKDITNWFHKTSMYVFVFVGFMLAILIFVPFVGINLNIYLISSPGKVYYEDPLIVVQESYNGVLSRPSPPDIYRKKYQLFVIRETSMLPCEVSDHLRVEVINRNDCYQINYINTDGSNNCSTRFMKN